MSVHPLTLPLTPATAKDLDRVMALERASFAPGHCEARAVYARRIEIFPQGSLLARQEGGVVGCLFAELWPPDTRLDAHAFELGHDIATRHDPTNGTTLYVASMAIDRAYRGQGLGAQLLAAAIAKLVTAFAKVDTILLLVNVQWTAAQAIYRTAGFREVTRLHEFFTTDGRTREDGIVMQRRVATR